MSAARCSIPWPSTTNPCRMVPLFVTTKRTFPAAALLPLGVTCHSLRLTLIDPPPVVPLTGVETRWVLVEPYAPPELDVPAEAYIEPQPASTSTAAIATSGMNPNNRFIVLSPPG